MRHVGLVCCRFYHGNICRILIEAYFVEVLLFLFKFLFYLTNTQKFQSFEYLKNFLICEDLANVIDDLLKFVLYCF